MIASSLTVARPTSSGREGADSLSSQDGVEGNDVLDGRTGAHTCSTDPTEESMANREQQG